MFYLLCGICAICVLIIGVLLLKIHGMHKTCDVLCTEFAAKLSQDTNVGIDIDSSDKNMRRLVNELDTQLRILRKEHLRYANGNRELQEAITNISHDLRTPLTAICGYLDLLEQEEKSDTVKAYLMIIENRVQVLKGLTEELFRYSVLVSVNQYESKEEVCLNQALEECVAGYYGTLKVQKITPEVVLPEAKIICCLNKAALVRILNNIMSNVVKYSTGDVKIELTKEGELCFSNDTKELDEIQVAKLFDRFYTVETGQKSTGLGLSIARFLTEQMGGKISAELNGKRLSVKISLPV